MIVSQGLSKVSYNSPSGTYWAGSNRFGDPVALGFSLQPFPLRLCALGHLAGSL